MSIDATTPPVGPPSNTGGAPPRLKRRLGLAAVALAWERLWPALWPAVFVLGGFVALALFDVPARIGPSLHWLLLAVTTVNRGE